jgi:hypothetical protein
VTVTRLLLLLALVAPGALAQLPDPRLTPGVARHDMTREKVCSTRWGRDARHVTDAMKAQVFAAYGFSGNDDPRCDPPKPPPGGKPSGERCEIDHLVSRELGGADDSRNLWPQPYHGPWNARMKDKLENRLHAEVCAGRITLKQAQGMLAGDWTAAYRRYYGEPR